MSHLRCRILQSISKNTADEIICTGRKSLEKYFLYYRIVGN